MVTLEQALSGRVDGVVTCETVQVDGVDITVHWYTEWRQRSNHDVNAWHVYRGTCMSIDVPAGWGGPNEAPSNAPGEQWHSHEIAGSMRVRRIDGVADSELAAAAAILVDTYRAHSVYSSLLAGRRKHVLRVLGETADAYDAAAGTGYVATQIRQRRDTYIQRALSTVGISAEEIQAAARIDARKLEILRAQPNPYTSPPLYLDIDAIARRRGVAPATVRSDRSRGSGGFPIEDIAIGGNPGWEWDTIEYYYQNRRGRGWAAGTTADITGHRA